MANMAVIDKMVSSNLSAKELQYIITTWNANGVPAKTSNVQCHIVLSVSVGKSNSHVMRCSAPRMVPKRFELAVDRS